MVKMDAFWQRKTCFRILASIGISAWAALQNGALIHPDVMDETFEDGGTRVAITID